MGLLDDYKRWLDVGGYVAATGDQSHAGLLAEIVGRIKVTPCSDGIDFAAKIRVAFEGADLTEMTDLQQQLVRDAAGFMVPHGTSYAPEC